MLHRNDAYNWYVALVAATCMVLYGYDASSFNADNASAAWTAFVGHPSSSTIGSTNTAYTCGAILTGFFVAGPLSKYTGRRVPMIVGSLLVIAATFIQVFGPGGSTHAFLGGRLLVGIGQGICLPIAPIYIAEMAPASIRGRMLTLWQLFYSVGSFICFWISYAASRHKSSLPKNWDWKLVVVFQILAPTFVISNALFIPESPRWLIQRGQHHKAYKSLEQVRGGREQVDEEYAAIIAAIRYESEHVDGSYKPLWTDKSLRRRLLLAFALNAGQQLTGQGSLNSYSSIVYKKVFSNPDTVQLINALNGTFGIIFTLNALLADRFGRRFLLLVGGLGMALLMLCAATVETQTPTLPNGSKTHAVGGGIVVCLYLFAFFYKPSWGATVWIFTSEIFSMNVRGQAMGMASQMQNVANAIVNQIFPLLLDKIGFYAFYMFW